MAGTHAGELFTARGAELYLVDGVDGATLMQSGQFTLMLVKNPVSQLAAVVAIVGEVQWPVGSDSTVVRKERSFSFMLPGPVTYDLILSSPSTDLQKLEHVLEAYSDYQKPAERQAQEDPITTTERSCSESRKRTASADITNPQLKGKMLRARRMSAVAKVFSKSLERGAINADSHVESMDSSASRQQISSTLALAGVDAVAKVVEAVETGGRTLLESAGSAAAGIAREVWNSRQSDASKLSNRTLSNLVSSGWTLNKLGLLMIFRVITASMAVHSSGSSSSGSSRSGSSSSSEFRRLLSSSASSSSLSGKSPTTPPPVQGGGTTDVTSCALSIQPLAGTVSGAAMPSPPVPPPPPLFSQNAPRIRHSHMPPPSGPPPRIAGAPSQAGLAFSDPMLASTPIRIYKPRPTSATPVTGAPPLPSFVPRPPRFQPPSRG